MRSGDRSRRATIDADEAEVDLLPRDNARDRVEKPQSEPRRVEAEKTRTSCAFAYQRQAQPRDGSPIVEAVVDAIEKLEARGHFGPFAVVLGTRSSATPPLRPGPSCCRATGSVEFLDGRRVQRSGVLPPDEGVVIALGGEPIELVLARDIDISFLQVTLEPRYVLRVFERFVLSIKELDAVCRVTRTDGLLLTPGFVARRAGA